MKHIREILALRKEQFKQAQQLSLFTRPAEQQKGSNEWSAFNAVQGTTTSGYTVRMPKKPIVLKEPRFVIRIIYPFRRLQTAE